MTGAAAVLFDVDGAYTRRKLASVDLATAFDAVLGRDDVARGKPAPEPFLALASALGRSTARCAHVGDRYEVDARPAVAAGLRGVWLDRPGADRQHRVAVDPKDPRVLEIRSLSELPDVLGLV